MSFVTNSFADVLSDGSASNRIKAAVLPSRLALPYIDSNPSDSTPVVFLHGITDSCRSYATVLDHLPHKIRAIAPSQRGHGDADASESYRIEEFAADLEGFLDALSLDRAILVGHSMGSIIAQRFAADHPERVTGLVLVGAVAALGRNPACVDFGATMSSLVDPIDPGFVREFQQSTLAQPIPTSMLEEVVSESLKVQARVWDAAWSAMLATDITPELSRIVAPTLLVWGDRDNLALRAEQDILLSSIPNARMEVFAGAGHAPHWEEPKRFAALVADFVVRSSAY